MKHRLLFLFLLAAFALNGQSIQTIERTLVWEPKPVIHRYSDDSELEMWRFNNSVFSDETPDLPVFSTQIPLQGPSILQVEVVSASWEPFAKKASASDDYLKEDLTIQTFVEQQRQRFFGRIRFIPVRKTGAGYERLVSFRLNVRVLPQPANPAADRNGPFTYTSALSDGTLYKFGVANSGIYKLDYTFLKTTLGISDLDNINPDRIQLFGNGGRMLPERNSDERPDDLKENAIEIIGGSDGKFDAGDYILFYAVGPAPWTYKTGSAVEPQLTVKKNLYDNYAWYFIKIGTGTGLRVGQQASVSATAVTTEFDDVQHIEDEKTNLLDFAPSATGSGKRWFGDYFYQTRQRTYTMDFPNTVTGVNARVKAEFAGRSGMNTTLKITVDGTVFTRNINPVVVSNNELPYAANVTATGLFQPDNDQVNFTIEYPEVSQQSEAWLDYLEVNVRRKLIFTGTSMEFRDLNTLSQDATLFRLDGVVANTSIWDITDPQRPLHQFGNLSGTTFEFGANTKNVLRNYIVFADNGPLPKPEQSVGKIANQNLHGLDNLHMLIVYAAEFETQAKQLAEHRKIFSGLDVATVDVQQVYNEFSSGGKDITAIRDIARMLYERNPGKFEYMLLFGDGSFDPKNNTNSEDNKDFIPAYETLESFSPVTAYPSDDYYALLSPEDGGTIQGGLLDIAVGRIPARDATEAQAVVDKILQYDKSPETLGDWHLNNLFLADDEDGNKHIEQADKLAIQTAETEKWFNVEKIYFDAYQQVATSAGQRFPDAKTAINSDIFKGMLVVQYIGHGGPRGWAQERVVDNNDIAGWDNPDRYPLIITATCSFGGYDDYTNLTGGEQVLLKVKSGAVALFTTVRAVYIDANERLTNSVQNVIFERIDGKYLSIGQILQTAKNAPSVAGEDNSRRFTLLGDPAMFLAMPEYRVATTKINGKTSVNGQLDTLRALMPVEIEGVVTDTVGNTLDGFNGRVFVTLFDKAQTLQTLAQDDDSDLKNFTVQRNIIFKGSATVTGGRFKIQFIVPKDINYTYGIGKINYYAENGTPLDAAGADVNIVIGGNANLIKDEQPPLVQPFLNTDAFVFGGITNNDPKILVKCSDDYGMNVTGTSLGHDLTAILDGNVLETIVLNDFYQSKQDDYRQGQAIFPLRNLTTGRHTLKVKGWDIANNPGEGYTEFLVVEDGKAALDHVLNYPNPFTTNTNFQFEHNLAGQLLEVQINIFTVSGRLVKTIFHSAPADGFRVTDINWDGRDDFGDVLARGVYLYRVQARGTDASGNSVTAESKFEKLVLLK